MIDTEAVLSAHYHAAKAAESGIVAHWMASHGANPAEDYEYHRKQQVDALAEACAALGFHMVAIDTGEVAA